MPAPSNAVEVPSSSAHPTSTFSTIPGNLLKSLPGSMYNQLVGVRDTWLNHVESKAKPTDIVLGDSLIPFAEQIASVFPHPSEAQQWKTGHEVIKSADVVFDCITLMMTKRNCLLRHAHAKRLSAYLLQLCFVLDSWTCLNVPQEEGVPTPEDLRRKSFESLKAVLANLGRSTIVDETTDQPAWRLLHEMMSSLLDTSEGILASLFFPFSVHVFKGSWAPHPQVIRSNSVTIEAGDSCDASLLISIVLHVISEVIPLHCEPLMHQIARRAVSIAQDAYVWTLSMTSPRMPSKQRRAAVSVVQSSVLIASNFGSSARVKFILDNMLSRRIKDPEVWSDYDEQMKEAVHGMHVSTSNCPETLSMLLTAIRDEPAFRTPAFVDLVATYVHRSLEHTSTSLLHLALDALVHCGSTSYLSEVTRDIHSQLSKNQDSDAKQAAWRARVQADALVVVDNADLGFMDDDTSESDAVFVDRVVEIVHAQLTDQLPLLDDTQRDGMCDRLSTLVSNAVQGLEAAPVVSLFVTLSPLLSILLDEKNTFAKVLPAYVLHSYRLLEMIIKFDGMDWSREQTVHLLVLLERGLTAPARSVRLSASRSIVQLFERVAASNDEIGQFCVARCFSFLDYLAKSGSPQVREAVGLTLGAVGRSAEGEVLQKTSVLLLFQLNHKSIYLRSIVQAQLVSIANKRGLTTSQLANPYLRDIAPAVVSQMISHPHFFHEIRRLLHHSSEDAFLSKVLPYTLPLLFSTRNRHVLEKIASIKRMSFFDIAQDSVYDILAECYLLPHESEANNAIQFTLELFASDSGNELSIDNLLASYLVSVVLSLVIIVGEHDPQRSTVAIKAFDRIARALGSRVNLNGGQSVAGVVLCMRMRGIVNELVLILQDSHRHRNYPGKEAVLRGLSWMMPEVGADITNVAPQIVACLQSLLGNANLQTIVLSTLHVLIKTLRPQDVGPYVGVVTATIVIGWPTFTEASHSPATQIMKYIVGLGQYIGKDHMDEIATMEAIVHGLPTAHPLLSVNTSLMTIRHTKDRTWTVHLQTLLKRIYSHNHLVVLQALRELTAAIQRRMEKFRTLFSGDTFDPLVGDIMSALYKACQRDHEDAEPIQLLAYECMGLIGAADPDRYEIARDTSKHIPIRMLGGLKEARAFAVLLISNTLVDLYGSTSDVSYQGHVIYAIQELARFCNFTSVIAEGRGSRSDEKDQWRRLPKHVLQVVSPLVEAGYIAPRFQPEPPPAIPIYPNQSLYRVWLQTWAGHLITKVSGDDAQQVFGVFSHLVRQGDAGVAHDLLPNLVLNIFLSGDETEIDNIRMEIQAVLQDQVHPDGSSHEKRLLSAQAVFTLIDQLSGWVRRTRRVIMQGPRRDRNGQVEIEYVESILSSIDTGLMAQAALKCKAYALSLMNFERQIMKMREITNLAPSRFHDLYERLHEIYAALDEPDGMDGVSTMIPSPSLEHQIRQHESNGRWTSAQSCWEVRLQEAPGNLDHHIGLLRCLRNLGHHDTLRTHVKGLLTRHQEWEPALAGLHVESAWMVGDWNDVENIVSTTQGQASQVMLARLLLAVRGQDSAAMREELKRARLHLGARLSRLGVDGHRQTYDSLVDLHLVAEVEKIHSTDISDDLTSAVPLLSSELASRLDLTLPTFNIRERILGMRRTAYQLSAADRWSNEITSSWLSLAKLARKAGNLQTAYGAVLQACQSRTLLPQIEAAKLTRATGEQHRALQELENVLRLHGVVGDDVIDVTDDPEGKRIAGKALVLRSRWIVASDRSNADAAGKEFYKVAEAHSTEAAWFHYAKFQETFRESIEDSARRGRITLGTVKAYAQSLRAGSKYIYQTLPRLLTLWLDLGEEWTKFTQGPNMLGKITDEIREASKGAVASWKWYLALSQLVSRIGHENLAVWAVLERLLRLVIADYPDQAVWLFVSTLKSTNELRVERGTAVVSKLHASGTSKSGPRDTMNACKFMASALLILCNDKDKENLKDREGNIPLISMKKSYSTLFKTAPSELIIPLQESLTANVLLVSGNNRQYNPFPVNVPKFFAWADEVEIMRSLAKPRKLVIKGTDGQTYTFLGKPRDDLRKDARIMDLNSIINRLLKARSEYRRRRLYVRTYSVVTLNEECGLVQWVPNTLPVRNVLTRYYDGKGIRSWDGNILGICDKIKTLDGAGAAKVFKRDLLSQFPPVFHEWFLETFPEPSAWFTSRLAYTRTAAVMSIVGHIIGLGDRHLENILLDVNTGDAVHVDLNCLFEKGATLETPERVPFRLTQNLVDGFGVTGVEGVFRVACELTMQLLRDNKDTLSSVLDAFIHDPLVEWRDAQRKTKHSRVQNPTREGVDLIRLAKTALGVIKEKLDGVYQSSKDSLPQSTKRRLETDHLVQLLIQEATDPENLGRMYGGWAAWH